MGRLELTCRQLAVAGQRAAASAAGHGHFRHRPAKTVGMGRGDEMGLAVAG